MSTPVVSEFVRSAGRKRSLEDGDAPDPKRAKFDFLVSPRRPVSPHRGVPLFVPDDTPEQVENSTQDPLLFRMRLATLKKKEIHRHAWLYAVLNHSVRAVEETAFARMQQEWDDELAEMFAEG